MKSVSGITLTSRKHAQQCARERLGGAHDFSSIARALNGAVSSLGSISMRDIDRKVKHGQNLTFEEAFCGMCYAIAATNSRFYGQFHTHLSAACGIGMTEQRALAMGTAFVQLMAAKESFRSLAPEEIAGMVAATNLDLQVRLKLPAVVETSGMGGDIGFEVNGQRMKTINVSTLSAFVLAAVGAPAIKHGSYKNTSAVGSTEAVEQLGAETLVPTPEDMVRILGESGFCYVDAHWCKTVHDLSHLLMVETVNHVIGPMTVPVAQNAILYKVMGVNEKAHPGAVARAYALLHRRGILNVGGVAVVGGLDERHSCTDPDSVDWFRRHCVLDELSPFGSVVAITIGSSYRGSFLVQPSDFGLSLDPSAIMLPNAEESIHRANVRTILGQDGPLGDYLAMNAALGLFVYRYARREDACSLTGLNQRYLRECYATCRIAISDGSVRNLVARFVAATGGTPAFAA